MASLKFIIPNRDDPEKPPTLYRMIETDQVPRVGDAVTLDANDEEQSRTWIVKWVEFRYTRNHALGVDVRLIEPGHRLDPRNDDA